MALSIKSERADRLARDLAELTGESITDAVVFALEARIEVERKRRHRRGVSDVAARFRQLLVLDGRVSNEILGYGDDGLPR
jgi:antitoxin VapB